MRYLIFILAVSFGAFLPLANGAGKNSKDVTKSKRKSESSLDNEISNAKLRAESGSTSSWSMSSIFSYLGSSVEKPFGKDLPNVAGSPVAPRVLMSGDLAARYRIDKNSSLRFGAGFSVIRPFHGAEEGEFNNPIFGYSATYRAMQMQMSSSFAFSITTNSDFRAIGDFGTISFSQTVLAPTMLTNWTFGATLSAYYTYFDKSDVLLNGIDGNQSVPIENSQIDLGLGISPFVEYQLSSIVSLRSVLAIVNYQHFRSHREYSFVKGKVYQTLGLGVSATRDIYISPYIYFTPDKITADNSTINITTVLNVF